MSLVVPTLVINGNGASRMECVLDATKCAEAYFGGPVALVREYDGTASCQRREPPYEFELEVTFVPLHLAHKYEVETDGTKGDEAPVNADKTTREDN